eukprot:TRINITY_DN67420_c8_g8_i1.p1 TRINITY_DN67420_c8_g8~~TRINITY_DN67420_c8_g8_i1.p1  ORF type:complete len:478 (+),score=56.66 TRINITY_DN67420_c8_g8_i1:50-1483(+)
MLATCQRLLAQTTVAVIGSGPGAFYAAKGILAKQSDVSIDFFEKLPVPYGLLRYGVAPDHPEVKLAWKTGEQVFQDERVQWLGNVNVGTDIQFNELSDNYDCVICAYGASEDRKMGIPGEDATGVYSARHFVEWYNGMPGTENEDFQLSSLKSVVVIGVGNVAMDVVRILNAPAELLQKTDITSTALEALAKSTVRDTYMVARRGPLQAAFTIKELREMINLGKGEGKETKDPNYHLDLSIDKRDLDEAQPHRHTVEKSRPKKRLTDLIYSVGDIASNNNERRVAIKFFLNPQKILKDDSGRVSAIEFRRNTVDENGKVATTDETVTIPCQMVVRAVGYASVPLENATAIPFDTSKQTISNKGGRVVDHNGNVIKGLYTSGWVGTGPVGVIVSTMNGAGATAKCVVTDIEEGLYSASNKKGREAIMPLLDQRNVEYTEWNDWLQINKAELEKGEQLQKAAEKFVKTEDLLQFRGASA